MRPPESPVHQFPSWTTSFALLSIAHITDCSTIHQALLSSPLYSTLHTLLCMCLYIQSLHKAGQGFGWMEREREIAYERTLFLSNLVWATPIFQLPTLQTLVCVCVCVFIYIYTKSSAKDLERESERFIAYKSTLFCLISVGHCTNEPRAVTMKQ